MKARHEFETEQDYQNYLRTYAAIQAMQGYIALYAGGISVPISATVAEKSVKYADALISELEKQKS
jgi:hypothetical protein